jgi:hypothetical protein
VGEGESSRDKESSQLRSCGGGGGGEREEDCPDGKKKLEKRRERLEISLACEHPITRCENAKSEDEKERKCVAQFVQGLKKRDTWTRRQTR